MSSQIEKVESKKSEMINTVQAELSLEHQYKQIGLAFNINDLMLEGGKYQQFTTKYAKFSNKNESTPCFLLEMEEHIKAFIKVESYEGEKSTNASIWVISRIWNKKFKAGMILDAGIKSEYSKIDTAKKQKVELHKAISKLAKEKESDSFEAGLKANLTKLMEETSLHQIGSLVNDIDSQKQLENIKQISDGSEL